MRIPAGPRPSIRCDGFHRIRIASRLRAVRVNIGCAPTREELATALRIRAAKLAAASPLRFGLRAAVTTGRIDAIRPR